MTPHPGHVLCSDTAAHASAREQGPVISVESEIVSSEAQLGAHDDGGQTSDRRGLTREALQT